MSPALFALAALLALPQAAFPAGPAFSAQDQQTAPAPSAAPRKTQVKKKGKKAKAGRKQARKKKQSPAREAEQTQAQSKADAECANLDPGLCEKDADCMCSAKGCFKGSMSYYERCVNKEENCLDFCWSRLLDAPYAMKCVDHKCASTTAP